MYYKYLTEEADAYEAYNGVQSVFEMEEIISMILYWMFIMIRYEYWS